MEAVSTDVPETSVEAAGLLVRAAQEGSVAAFERLYRIHVGRVHALCLRLSGDAVLAEELTQDVFVRAWEKLESFRGESALSTWLHRLAVNVVLASRRSEGRRSQRVVVVDDLAVFGATAPPSVGERMDLDAAITALPDAARTVFVLHEVEGYTHEEIAELTGRAEGTCKALLHRARGILRERLR
jgi:RNA polymerase sigma-70 factor (ECF subfamily)